MTTDVDLLVLAGGHGERLGGRDKAALVVSGRTLLDRVLEAVPVLGGRAVVVGDTPVPEGVEQTLEDPPDGGPVAGIAAGLQVLHPAAEWVAVVAVDQPGAARALAALWAGLPDVPEDVDAVSQQDAEGHRQWLLAVYRRSALERALHALGDVRHVSVRRLVADLPWQVVERGTEHVGDVDTWQDAQDWERRLGHGKMSVDRSELEG